MKKIIRATNLIRSAARDLKFRAMFEWCRWRAARRIAAVKRQYPNGEGVVCVNSWPPIAGTTTGYKAQGVTTIQWGTDGLLQSPKPSGTFYVVTRFGQQTMSEKILLPNGTGISTTRILLIDGQQFNLNVRDDSAMTPPKVGDTCVITDGGGFLGTVGLVYTCRIVDSSWDAAPKQAGERVIVAENLVLIESQTPGSAV